MKQQLQYIRKGATITNVDTKEVETYKSINLAKKASRALQGTTQGQGMVSVTPHKQKPISVSLHKSYRTKMPVGKVKKEKASAVEQAAAPKHKVKVTTKKASV